MPNRFYPGGWKWCQAEQSFKLFRKRMLDVKKLKQGLLEVEQARLGVGIVSADTTVNAFKSNLD